MPSRSNQTRRRSGRYRPLPDYTPLYGIRLYGTESGYLISFIAMVIYSAARVYMSMIEQKNAGSFEVFALLGILSSALLFSGGLLVLLGTHIKNMPGIFLFSGLALLLLSDGIFCFCVAIETLAETDILGVIQCVFEVMFLLSLFVILAALLISCLNRRTAPSVGYFPTVISLFAVALLLVRTLTTFASLSSALGTGFSWDQTADLPIAINWVMRSVSVDSDYAADMYYARLLERITLILMFISLLPPIFRFASFFRQYNMQMEISAELPGGQRKVMEQRGSPYASGRFDLMSSLNSLREPEGSEEPEEEFDEESLESDDEAELGYCTPDYISGFDEPEEPIMVSPVSASPISAETAEKRPLVVVYNTNMLDADYGKPIEPQENDVVSSGQDKAELSSKDTSVTHRVKLKAKSSIPSPEDESIWYHYSDD